MHRHHAVIRASAAWCLQYPDAAVRDKLPLLRQAVTELPVEIAGRAELLAVLDHLRDTAPLRLCADYVETFDRKPRRTLHVSWYGDGDTRRRGATLAALRQHFRANGYAPAEAELPDFLPVLLEYTAHSGDAAPLVEFRPGLELLLRQLAMIDTPYRHAVAAVLATLPADRPRVEAAATPPTELVGLDAYPTRPGRNP